MEQVLPLSFFFSSPISLSLHTAGSLLGLGPDHTQGVLVPEGSLKSRKPQEQDLQTEN